MIAIYNTVNQVEQKQAIAGVFTRSAETYGQVGPQFFAYFGERLVDLANIPPNAAVLDIASGRGAVLFPASEKVSEGHVTGIDFSEGMVEQTSKAIDRYGFPNVDIRQMDAEALVFADSSFDIVLCGYALFFFPSVEKALSEIRRVLKPGGRFITSTWGDEDERWAWYGELLNTSRPPHIPPAPMTEKRFNHADGMTALLTDADIMNVTVVLEEKDFVYADEEAWLATQWSHGARAMLERLSSEQFENFKQQAFQRIQQNRQTDGIHHRLHTVFTSGMRPL